MYEEQEALFFYCVSPVHMGADTSIGLIDNPIQRERHTDYPMFSGSGLKGAVRHHFRSDGWNANLINRIFGPERNPDFAGALSFGDAQLVAFPMRCTKRAFVYATSPTALARAKRQLESVGAGVRWSAPSVDGGACKVVPESPLSQDHLLHLEAFEHRTAADQQLQPIADWLSGNALPQQVAAYRFFRDKLRTDLVLLSDEDFAHYVKNATMVEPHVRIDDDTGAADAGGLFYTENLPPESLLLGPIMTSGERSGNTNPMAARAVLATVINGQGNHNGLDGLFLQVGGDATTGRGQVVVTKV